MPRGRPPYRGLKNAIPVARARGRVMRFFQDDECAADLLIAARGGIIFVRIRRSIRIRIPISDLEAEFREPVLMLRSLPRSGHILREFWLYSKYGTWRYFRVDETGLVEIDYAGQPLPLPVPNQGKIPAAL
ncbi:hypothetical protein [uncultured Methanoregula sp.]|uniref:hypothetical protein n=1 Tax=uncultured Methanoregula sp. TaxID=1005933 RepID=UPI002AAB40AE|nr:hypothetical protein [uncultured Methanoregula sp.]